MALLSHAEMEKDEEQAFLSRAKGKRLLAPLFSRRSHKGAG